MADFSDGSYNMNPKLLSLVKSEEDAVVDATSEHRQVGKRAKTRAPSKEKEGAAAEEDSDERSDSDYDEEEEQEGEGEEEEHHHTKERAKVRAPSEGKKRAEPAGGADKSKAAKKNKTGVPACQVEREE